MCGINFVQSSFEIKIIDYKKELTKCHNLIKKNEYENLLKIVRKLKRNQIYLEIIKNKNIYLIRELKLLVLKIKKKRNQENFDLIEDILWVINYEIFEFSKKIKNYHLKNNIEIHKKTIIFLRYYINSLESLNYLETRGRDSASLSLNFLSEEKINFPATTRFNNLKLSFFQKKINNNFLSNLTIKYANQIGYSGENIEKLDEIFFSVKFISKLDFKKILSFYIVGHTRWASVGEVSLSNCHPLVNNYKNENAYFYMNGDILNHDKLISKSNKNKKNILSDKNCKNDLGHLPILLEKKQKLTIKELQGSFVLVYHRFSKPFEMTILKKGTHGLYAAVSNDGNFLLSSDVYGIVNNSNYFSRISNRSSIIINPFHNNNFKSKINIKKLNKTNISTRDLNKKGFSRFFLKEINDTEIFLKRTISNYLDLKKNKIKNMENLFSNKIKKSLVNSKIKNIIFTGMGSCYTAGVGISKYLSDKLGNLNISNIKVEATIASEGSGFYLSKNMSDTIIVVIAQSGTTIDTNVFAKMAKSRGAYTISLANKRDGDITYLVENNLYLGNGRDVELSVPSTKTYTCHLYLGFILADKIASIFKNKHKTEIFKNSNKILKQNYISDLVSKHEKNINVLNFDITKYKKWILVYDDSMNAYNSLEFRIKLSECCYKSILYMHIDQFNDAKLSNCLIFYIGQKNNINERKLNNNFLLSISTKKLKKHKNLISIKLKNNPHSLLAIESSIVLQLVAFRLSILIDQIRFNLNKNISNKNLINFIIDKKDQYKYLKIINKNSKINFLSEKLKRPIDAIKHQAKTVTVGAIRVNKNENFFKERLNKVRLNVVEGNFKGKFLSLKNNINLDSVTKYEIEKYFLGNLIEYYNQKYNKNYFYNFIKISENEKNKYKNFSNLILDTKKIYNSNNILFEKKIIDSHNIIKTFLPNDQKSLIAENKFILAKKHINEKPKLNLKKHFKSYNNLKFLGSGINYLVAKKFAQRFSKKYNIAVGFDVIENHKHIDISSESLIVIFSSNIYRPGFQNDVVSEIEKFIAHNNTPIIFTNTNNYLYDKFKKSNSNIEIIKLPRVDEIYSLSIFEHYFKSYI